MECTEKTRKILEGAEGLAFVLRNEYVMPEHVLSIFLSNSEIGFILNKLSVNKDELLDHVDDWLVNLEKVPYTEDTAPRPSVQYDMLQQYAAYYAKSAGREVYDIPHLFKGMLDLKDSMVNYLLHKYLDCCMVEFERELIDTYDPIIDQGDEETDDLETFLSSLDEMDEGDLSEDGEDINFDDLFGDDGEEASASPPLASDKGGAWQKLVTCMNDMVNSHNPLIGREAESERTIQVLCRKDKNNPLHVGEPGVGKTALVYGLVNRIVKGDVPPRLQGCTVYQMDMGAMVAGTQYRGDFEKRIKRVMEGVRKKGNAIVYIDEIHNMIGAGSVSDSSLDASNMLKPYLEKGEIRFIGSTTYDEYNRYFAKSRGVVRRFQQIDIPEPSVEEAVNILKGLKKKYEEFHHVTYSNEVIEYAVKASAKHISDRFLPDKAIDLIDEAGAYRELHPIEGVKRQKVDKALVSEVLAKVCKVDAAAMKEENNQSLKTLQANILAKIYGQDEAVRQVVEAVQMAKAGLTDDDKPLASLLFVGPTGVGKTEVAHTLAKELGISLVRFDMSEYTEKHAVAKLIGSPAGYVGYEDGGLLTDAIRKTPNCVLLFDEIEKAHEDIYNILLQVMDYARLTDNKGQKADFRNVILIMTSNAGAQYASQANVGFTSRVSRGEAMLAQVKKTFKPEFINRLSGTVVFHDMSREMASLILDKKLRELQDKLTQKKVTMQLSDDARNILLEKGYTKEYGAREMDRVIAQMLKPLLMREILFGKLKKGGIVHIVKTEEDGKLKIEK